MYIEHFQEMGLNFPLDSPFFPVFQLKKCIYYFSLKINKKRKNSLSKRKK